MWRRGGEEWREGGRRRENERGRDEGGTEGGRGKERRKGGRGKGRTKGGRGETREEEERDEGLCTVNTLHIPSTPPLITPPLLHSQAPQLVPFLHTIL